MRVILRDRSAINRLFAYIAALVVAVSAQAEGKRSLNDALREQRGKGQSKLAYIFMDAHSGDVLAEHLAGEAFKPASIMKLITSYVALRQLGPEFRFRTKLYAKRRDEVVQRIVLVGGGSPSFTSEDLWLMARALRLKGIKKVEELVIDDSLFRESRERSGQRAYEAGTSSISFNFNALAVHVCSSIGRGSALVTTDPFELAVPITGTISTSRSAQATYTVDESGKTSDELPRYRVGGSIQSHGDCEAVYRSVAEPAAYVARTFLSFLNSLGIAAPETWKKGKKGAEEGLIFEHESPPLYELVGEMNHYSNNFMADQFIYALGKTKNLEWSFDRGLRQMKDEIERNFSNSLFRNYDGSGLSHQNRVTARLMVEVLRSALTDPSVGPEFMISLPVAGRNGTLKDRSFLIPHGSLRAKTGTLDGVNSLAGVLTTKRGKAVLFAIINNGAKSRSSALQTERKLLERVYTW
jgi:serine-type D-Ala-D-Ala carboxypeptidase/endopeptidase (penicillin-binding protein 4)